MKLIKLLFVSILVFVVTTNAFLENKQVKKENSITVKVIGMVCTSCEKDIEQTFEAKKEVKSVDAIFDEKSIKLVFNEGMRLSDEEIKTIVADLGYNVTSIN